MKGRQVSLENDFLRKSPIRRLLPASGIREVFDLANALERSGEKILHLEIGRPAWRLPPGVEECTINALRNGFSHYLPNRGILELRESISLAIKNRTGVTYDPETEIIVTLGASEALSMACLAFLRAGDEAVILLPAWPHYASVVQLTGATPRFVETYPQEGFLYDPEAIESAISPCTRMIIINSPSNPTGAVQPKERLQTIAQIADKYNLILLSDEVYQDFVYEGVHFSMAEIVHDKSRLIIINSFSKSFAMTGWRIGYVTSNKEFSEAMNRIHQYLTVCGVSFAQKGVTQLLSNSTLSDYFSEMQEAFHQRYQVWRNAFIDCPNITLVPPGGAFYIFPRIEYKGLNAVELSKTLLERIHVAVVPGNVFGEVYKNCIRVSYGLDLEIQKEAVKRLTAFLKG